MIGASTIKLHGGIPSDLMIALHFYFPENSFHSARYLYLLNKAGLSFSLQLPTQNLQTSNGRSLQRQPFVVLSSLMISSAGSTSPAVMLIKRDEFIISLVYFEIDPSGSGKLLPITLGISSRAHRYCRHDERSLAPTRSTHD